MPRVSIHARAWRATCGLSGLPYPEPCFNPRPRMAGDWQAWWGYPMRKAFQSTPAHGGRPHVSVIVEPSKQFQSTPAHGGRPVGRGSGGADACFNPRPRMAGDYRRSGYSTPGVSFNPRPRMAGDLAVFMGLCRPSVSIHARAWRATKTERRNDARNTVSIHARAWRATWRQSRPGTYLGVSIHARAWRAT